MPEDIRDTSARLLSTAALAGGFGAALYQGYKQNPGLLSNTLDTVTGVRRTVPETRLMTSAPVAMQEKLLQEAFSAGQDVMSGLGWRETLVRTYERALQGAGIVGEEERLRILDELGDVGGRWDNVRGALLKYEHQLGGFEGIYRSMRELAGGTIRGNRGKDLSSLLRKLPEIPPDATGQAGGYTRSAFEPGQSFWEDRFPLKPVPLPGQSRLGEIPGFHKGYAKRISESLGQDVIPGVREVARPRTFQKNQAGSFEFKIPDSPQTVKMPYVEYQIGQQKSSNFLQVPTAVQHKGMNFVAGDHRGMSFSSVPKFAVPVNGGTKYKVVDWNEGIGLMLFGDDTLGITGLAQRLHQLHGDRKAQRDLSRAWNTSIRGLSQRVTSSQGGMTQALLHSDSVVPMDFVMGQMTGDGAKPSIEGLQSFWDKMVGSGFNVGPTGSGPMSKEYRLQMSDMAKKWDVFGEFYPIERKFTGRVRAFSLTQDSMKAMQDNPIMGILPRGHAITATNAARTQQHAMPNVVGYLSLENAKHFAEEEAVISNRLAPMMTTRTVQKFEVMAGTTMAKQGDLLQGGTPLGVDYRTGRTLEAVASKGLVEQRIIDATEIDGIVRLEVETQLPLQDVTKTFHHKANVHRARGSMVGELAHEWAPDPGAAVNRYAADIEYAGHADLMKKIPAEINRQMSEALWVTSANRLRQGGVTPTKMKRHLSRLSRGQKTYNWSGGIASGDITSEMFNFVHAQGARDRLLRKVKRGGKKLTKQIGLKTEQRSVGIGLELLRQAKKHHLDSDDISLIGGAFYKTFKKQFGEEKLNTWLSGVGLSGDDISALSSAKGVLAMPSMQIGDYGSFTHLRGRSGMDYRALMEIKAQGQWGRAGDSLITEIARRVMPHNDLSEMRKAAGSLVGDLGGISDEVETISSIRQAQENLGKKEFIFDYGEKQIYVPGPGVSRMGQTPNEIGDVSDQDLRRGYSQYIKAQQRVRDDPSARSSEMLVTAEQNLKEQVTKEWMGSGSLRGKVIGTTSPVARRKVPKSPSAQSRAIHFESIDDFIKAQDDVFTIGVTKDTGEKMFRDLMRRADQGELEFLSKQREAFLSGEKISGFSWRHPTHRPQSLMPSFLQLESGKGEAAYFSKMTMNTKTAAGEIRTLDLSLAQGMKLDYDFDHVELGIIANEKTKLAVDELLNGRRYREQFVQGLEIQSEIMERVKNAAASGLDDVAHYAGGLQKLVGVKMETGVISNLVGDMRAAAAFNSSGHDFSIASYLLAELEEGPISSKHGLHVGDVKKHLRDFVSGEGVGVKNAMAEAWEKLLDSGEFTAGKIKYSRDEFIDNMSTWISEAEESGELGAFRNLVRRGAKAQKGDVWSGITDEQLNNALKQASGGMGDLNSALTQELRMGPGSGVSTSRKITQAASKIGRAAINSFRKHWKYPALGLASAMGISATLGGNSDLSMGGSDPNSTTTALGQGPSVPSLSSPTPFSNRIVVGGGGGMNSGVSLSSSGDYGPSGVREISNLAAEVGASVTLRDNRGSITPEYIQKAQRERYY